MNFADRKATKDYLYSHGLISANQFVRIDFMPGGVSSDVLRVDTGDQVMVLKQALPRLKVKEDWRADTRRNVTERLVMDVVHDDEPAFLPKVLFVDERESLFAMQYIAGRTWKEDLLAGHVDESVADALGQFLGRIHAKPASHWDKVPGIKSKTLFHQLRIAPYFEILRTRYPSCEKSLNVVVAAMNDVSKVLVHGDFSPKNILLQPTISGIQPVVLDWEVAHIGHPSFDVGFMMTHLSLKAIHASQPGAYVDAGHRFYAAYFLVSGLVEGEWRDITLRTTGALMMARIDGKSPVEYLMPREQMLARKVGQALLTGEVREWSQWDAYIRREARQV